jgi:hypothetical protein
MPKAEKGTPKDIANRAKAKGLQKVDNSRLLVFHPSCLQVSDFVVSSYPSYHHPSPPY